MVTKEQTMTTQNMSIAILSVLILVSVAPAHLCNDVFDQAEDNLAVKVDIRDGQLRIDEEATFRVYLLNTMDRNIADIDLQIISDEFDATVTPSSSWTTFPVLKTVNAGGQKEYFEVKLMRKEGVADGEYEIKLKLVNGRDDSMVYKTLDLASSAETTDVPEAEDVTIDGDVTRDEWGDATIVTDLHRYVREGRYFCNAKAEDQPRFRVQADSETLFIATTFQGGADATDDAAVIHLARDLDSEPVSIALDRLTKEIRCYRGMERSEDIAEAIEVVFSEDGKTVECAIPLSVLELDEDQSAILMNFSRQMTIDGEDMSCYWQGNASSRFDPVVYAEFVLASLSDEEDADSDE
jgi:hypothetical protein